MGEHDVVAARSGLWVEGDGPLQACMGMDEAGEAGLPGRVGETGHGEGVRDAVERGGNEARLAGEVERDVDHGLNVGWGEVEIAAGFV